MGGPKQMDPWGQVRYCTLHDAALFVFANFAVIASSWLQIEDLDGNALYAVLDVGPNAQNGEIKKVRLWKIKS